MAYDGSGNFSPLPPPVFPAIPGNLIEADYFNQLIQDMIQNGLSRVLTRDGQAAMTGVLDLGGYRIKNLGSTTENSDAVSKLYVDDAIAAGTQNLRDDGTWTLAGPIFDDGAWTA